MHPPILHICFLSFLKPSYADPLLPLRVMGCDYRTLGGAQKNLTSAPLQVVSLLQPTPSNSLILVHKYNSPTQMIAAAYKANSLSMLQGPLQPNNNTAYEALPHSAQAHSDDLCPLVNLTDLPSPLSIFSKSPHTISLSNPANSPMDPHPSHLRPSNQLVSLCNGTCSQQAPLIRLPTPGMSPPASGIEVPFDPSVDSISPQKNKKRKGKQLPTRRSQRQQARQPAFATPPKRSIRANTCAKGIPFLPDTQDTPINITETLQILQATGLEINKQVQDLIEEAVRKDLQEGRTITTEEQIMPTTQLHDPIPPMAIPGFDLPL